MFAGWTRYCCWCMAVDFKFLAWKALHCTLYHTEQFFAISAMNVADFDTYSCQFPTFRLESPFLCPLLSMCSSLR